MPCMSKKPKKATRGPDLGNSVKIRIDLEDEAYIKSLAEKLNQDHISVRASAVRLGVDIMKLFDGIPADVASVIKRMAREENRDSRK